MVYLGSPKVPIGRKKKVDKISKPVIIRKMIAQIKIDPENQTIKRPVYQGDVGYDLVSYSDPKIVGETKSGQKETSPEETLYTRIDYIEYDTNVRIAPDGGFYAQVYARSSINKYNLALANHVGVIDSGYRGNIKVLFRYVVQPSDIRVVKGRAFFLIDYSRIYNKGDKVAQLVWAPHFHPHLEFVNDLPLSERGDGGFGSSGI